ncbi:MAG: hypothetical protein EXR93_09660 [Gemmatimonadetes bacterium]|nr:hypothetical protein [Gemmatimonadota bacterium]
MKRSSTRVIQLLAVIAGIAVAPSSLFSQAARDYISGRVVSEGGRPEAGVWVIAESKDVMPDDGRGADNYRKIVVTDPTGKYVLPDLPNGTYDVWVRGYGLKDSRATWTVPGKVMAKPGARDLELAVERATTPQEAAKVYPANYWYSLLQLPPKSMFPGDGKYISAGIKSQDQWMGNLKLNCNLCHQIGTAATRLPNRAAWEVAVHKSPNMFSQANSFGYESLMDAFGDWSKRIQAGEVPPAPPRPSGLEANVVLTLWEVSDLYAHTHDLAASDDRNPNLNANGPIYLVDYAQDWLIILDPVKNSWKRVRVPIYEKSQRRQGYMALGTPVPGGHTNFGGIYDHSNATPHNSAIDEHGRVWLTTSLRGYRPPYCPAPAAQTAGGIAAATGGEGGGGAGSFTMYDPKTGKMTVVPVCFGTHHLEFAVGPDGRLWTCSLGYIDTNKFDPDNPDLADLSKAWGQADYMIDSDGDGKKDMKWQSGGYGMYPTADGAIFGTQPGPFPGKIDYYNPKTNVFEVYEPPYGSGPRGIAVDSKGVAWTALAGSGHLARFDRSKCKQTWGTGKQCPEGWTLWKTPGPTFKGFEPSRPEENASAEQLYYIWVDRFNASGFGEDAVIVNGTGGDNLHIMDPKTEKFTTVRVPYPLQYNSRGADARIDNPNGGWKGRGIWSVYSSTSSILTETKRPSIVQTQFRPDPLAH